MFIWNKSQSHRRAYKESYRVSPSLSSPISFPGFFLLIQNVPSTLTSLLCTLLPLGSVATVFTTCNTLFQDIHIHHPTSPNYLCEPSIDCISLPNPLSFPACDKGNRLFKHFLLGWLAQCLVFSIENTGDTLKEKRVLLPVFLYLTGQASAVQVASPCSAPTEHAASLAFNF